MTDLVKRLRKYTSADNSYKDLRDAADRIEALEAAAAQPSREAALVKALQVAMVIIDTIPWPDELGASVHAALRKRREAILAVLRSDTPAKDERREEAK